MQKIERDNGSTITSFEEIASRSMDYFKGIYKADKRVAIAKVVRMTSFIPSFVG